ncbi:hypothetical protein A4R40_16310 [Photorhabdus laumondii subsp. laumondii]|nr:hypothetical protein A4R40_16310 [Photorhabdus laumondii subsp. laumondii]
MEQVKYTLWISRCIAAARERIPGSIDNYVTGVSECSQQRSNLKDDGYKHDYQLKLMRMRINSVIQMRIIEHDELIRTPITHIFTEHLLL